MFPYQIYQAVTDQHLRDLRPDTRRHELAAAARNSHDMTDAARTTREDRPEVSSRIANAATQLLALLHVRDRSPERSTPAAPAAPAGPMGCVA